MTKALIIGGGVAGMATAMALRHAGLDAAVYEAHPTGADGKGAFLTIMANGLDALRAIDADHLVLDHSFPSGEVRMRNHRDRSLGVLTIPVRDQSPRTIRRADLHRVLSDEAERRGVEITHGKRLSTVDDDTTAVFTDGTSVTGDLVIGADGVWSTTRTQIDADAPAPAYTGWHIVFGAVRHVPIADSGGAYYMYFGHRANCGHVTSPDGETWWFANVPSAEGEFADHTPADLRHHLVSLFAHDRTPTVDAIAATDNAQITATACYELPTVPTWHVDRLTLVGDALHVASPATTQGASMAIEDGVTLAKCLRDLPNIPAAFRAYEQLRRTRVERVVASGRRKTGPALPGPLLRLLRDRAVAKRVRRPDVDWLHLHHIDWSAGIA
ncbi:FAD-dependent monooxygenase [Kibdelosporangium lantanae]